MIYLLLVIITSASFNIYFKIFERVGVNAVQAIIINYIVAGSVSFALAPNNLLLPTNIVNEGWFYGGVALGALFYVVMYLYSLTTRNFGVSVTTLMTRTSLILPALVAYLFLGEPISSRGWIAMPLIMLAIYLLVIEPKGKNGIVTNKQTKQLKWYIALLPLLVFIGGGSTDTTIKLIQHSFIETQGENAAFTFVVYFSSLIMGLIAYLTNKSNRGKGVSIKTIIGGVLMGVSNVINVYCVLKALSVVPATIAFPIINIGIVSFSVLVGIFAFKERITLRKGIGIVMAVVAIFLLT